MAADISNTISGLTKAKGALSFGKKIFSGGKILITSITGLSGITILATIILLSIGLLAIFALGKTAQGGFGNNPLANVGSGGGALTYPSGAAPEQLATCLDNWMKKEVPNSPLIGHGLAFAKAGQQYNVNPGFMVAITRHESVLATAGCGKESHGLFNPLGWGCNIPGSCTNCKKFNNWDEGITYITGRIRTNYLDEGLTDIPNFAKKYTGAPYVQEWTTLVTKYFNSVTFSCPYLVVSNQVSGVCGQRILAIAQKEVGYKTNNGDCTKYYNGCLPWCAIFTSWVYKQAGYFNTIEPGTESLFDNYQSQLTVIHPNGDASKIHPGDIFRMKTNLSKTGYHVGIVVSVTGNTVRTIEGNLTDDKVAERNNKTVSQMESVARPKSCQ